MNFYKGSTTVLPRVSVTVGTCAKSRRGTLLRGMAAYTVDVSSSGEPAFILTPELRMAGVRAGTYSQICAWEEEVAAHFRALHARYSYAWLRAMHNPNLVFMDDTVQPRGGDRVSPRHLAAKHYVAIMREEGYQLAVSDTLTK